MAWMGSCFRKPLAAKYFKGERDSGMMSMKENFLQI